MRGLFVTFEGIEGAGKSTQMTSLAQSLRQRSYDVCVTREPGGSPAAEALRYILLSSMAEKDFGPDMEAILFAAARHDHVETIIRPAILSGKIVLCDRFIDSTYAYQIKEELNNRQFVTALQELAVEDMLPDCTIILDLPADVGLERVARRQKAQGKENTPLDRFEKEYIAVHEQRRQSFLKIAQDNPCRCYPVDSTKNCEYIAEQILKIVETCLLKRGESTV
ncbi:Thymidylate kinase [Liberibacter crescens BT-1]|uniref:Thymidylate kinase n=1 Tax=Liberibacter crescens (strain BT-1) TaxID=1215343 RepID=L0EVB5_LIBCB|nr:dTMP kinase [Liberibacter crescens]AGA64795.1 Thymidylate kinase [Liberibacter crescens BT-1]AMC12859.1 thymidylate kinase [Liberibacter crescens]